MPRPDPPFLNPEVESAFAAFPQNIRDGLLELRALIFETAAATPGVGRVEEALRWGQPAYLTPDTRSGSTIRLGPSKAGGFALFVHCQTTILSEFRSIIPGELTIEGNRAVRFRPGEPLPRAPVGLLVARALTYHLKPAAAPVGGQEGQTAASRIRR